ncbi:MAG: septum formation protein Maf [Burkholderiales bacterium]|jgi:septum formation protein|nr:septum formation protein Maf [Burkholderiales bacterium]MCA3230594.1 septum formation protein Maf [Burkholderiales bacterium]
MPPIVLASTSPYRRELLARLRLPFEVTAPSVDETPVAGEPPRVLARRLALAKAGAVARQRPEAIVIGSDQVVDLAGEPLGKPGGFDAALEQLERMQGREVVFHTAVAVIHGALSEVTEVPTTVAFRQLPPARLAAYLATDKPYDCAGSARIESLGIALLRAVRSDDPTALIGLPLIAVIAALERCGVTVPG